MSIIKTNSQHYTNIASAIRAKNGESTLYYPREMARAIRNLPTGAIPGDPKLNDIFNHGTIVGQNTYCGTSSVYINNHENVSKITKNNSYWEKEHYGSYDETKANGPLLVMNPFYNMDFHTICIDCEVLACSSDFYKNYTHSYIGAMKYSPKYPDISTNSSTYAYVTIDPFTVKSNDLTYSENGEAIVPTFGRSVVKLTIPQNEPGYYYPGFYNINSVFRVYAMWMEK